MNNQQSGRWPPKRCEMPDLSNLFNKVVLNLILNRTFGRGGPKDQRASMLVSSYVRLVDKTLVEYEAARTELLDYVNSPNNRMSPLFRAVAHMETCINTLQRAIRLAERIRRDKQSPLVSKLTVLSPQVQTRIRKIRDAIEHMDERIIQGRVPQGEPIALMLKSDAVELVGEEMLYSELAAWITALHTLAEELAAYREPS